MDHRGPTGHDTSAAWRAAPLVLRARLRRGWASVAGLVLLFGLAGGVALGALSAARRVESSYDRLLAEVDTFDLLVPTCVEDSCRTVELTERLEGSGLVDHLAPVRALSLPTIRTATGLYLGPDPTAPCQTGEHEVNVVVAPDGWGPDGGLPTRLREGSAPAATKPGIVVPVATAERAHLAVGDTVDLIAIGCNEGPALLPEPVEVEVTGIGAGPLDIDTPGGGFSYQILFGNPALLDALADQPDGLVDVDEGIAVWLKEGALLTDSEPFLVGAGEDIITVPERAAVVGNSLGPDATALRALAGMTALASMAVLGQLLARHLRAASKDGPILTALGASPRDQWVHGMVEAAIIGVAGAGAAVAIAVAVSPWMPLGFAEAIEGPRTMWVHVPTLVLAAGAMVVAVLALAALPARRAGRSPRRLSPVTEAWPARLARRARLGVSASAGVRAAFDSERGPGGAPVRQGTAALAIALGVVAGVLAFSAGLSHLRAEPRLLGWGWDAMIPIEEDLDTTMAQLAALPDVERATAGTFFPPSPDWTLSSGGEPAEVYPITFATGPDAITPVVTAGRAPQAADEILVAGPVAERLGVDLGDAVELTGPSLADIAAFELGAPPEERSYETTHLIVVGRGVIVNEIESGVALTVEGMASALRISAADEAALQARLSDEQFLQFRAWRDSDVARPQMVMVDVRGGRSAALRLFEDAAPEAMVPRDGDDLIDRLVFLDLTRVSRVPDALGALFALVVVGVGIHVLALGARARWRDLAMLRALGMRRRQIRGVVAWQASATILLPVLIGIPVGTILGRWAWERYAAGLNVVPEAATPWWKLGAVVAAALVAANAVAMVAAWRALRRSPAEHLRAE